MWIWIALIILICLTYYLKKSPSNPIVIDLIIYPIKSCGGIHLQSSEVNEFGMLYDRQWVLLSPDNKIVTQQDDTNLINLMPRVLEKNSNLSELELTYHGKSVQFKPQKIGEIIEFECKKAQCEGMDEGKDVSDYLEKVLQKPYRLVRVIKHRKMNEHPKYEGLVSDEHNSNFVNSAQFLVISEESHLKTKKMIPNDLKNDLDIGCFRANIIVRGCSPFEEETWARFRIGDIEFEGIGRCQRCKITTVHHKTLQYDPDFEPVTTLRSLNGNGTKAYLGMHCVRHTCGEIRVGQRVLVKETKKFPDI